MLWLTLGCLCLGVLLMLGEEIISRNEPFGLSDRGDQIAAGAKERVNVLRISACVKGEREGHLVMGSGYQLLVFIQRIIEISL